MEWRVIELTSAAHKHGNLNIRACGKDFFPEDVFGGSCKKAGVGGQITLQAKGLAGRIKTDIPTDKRTGRIRWIFRERSWVKEFVRANGLRTGEKIFIMRGGPSEYLIMPLWKRFSEANNGKLRVSLKEVKDFLEVPKQDSQRHHLPELFPLPQSLAERKKSFLNNLISPSGKTKYKRYVGAPIRYAGGKSLAVGLVVERIPENVKRIVSPFLGGGSVEVAIAKELGLPVIAYDVFDILITYWKAQLNNQKALYARLLEFSPTRKGFKQVKDRLKKHWKGEEKLGKFDLAAHFYFNHNTSYGPHFLGWPSSVYLQKERYQKMIEKVRNFRVENMKVECASFEDIMTKHKNDFLYCDPPYYLEGDSKTFVGMYPHRNFPIHHKGFKHDLLRDLLMEHSGGFILSYNDCSIIREWYKDFHMINPSWQYTFSQGDTRIGENRSRDNNGSYIKKSHELLIWSLPK